MDAQAWVAVIPLPGAPDSVCGLVGVQGPVEVPTPHPPGRCCPPSLGSFQVPTLRSAPLEQPVSSQRPRAQSDPDRLGHAWPPVPSGCSPQDLCSLLPQRAGPRTSLLLGLSSHCADPQHGTDTL